MDDKTLRVIDEHGNEIDYEIVFTYTDDSSKKSYVVYKEPGDSDEVFAAIYEPDGDGGNLLPIETDEEWDMIEEKLDAYLESEETHHHHEE